MFLNVFKCFADPLKNYLKIPRVPIFTKTEYSTYSEKKEKVKHYFKVIQIGYKYKIILKTPVI